MTPDRRELLLAEGQAIRKRVPRQALGEWKPSARRHDPLALLKMAERGRLPELLPLRYGRMSRSPFAYMRGAAAVTAADVAGGPLTGIVCQACGDCHPGNFGVFASPERRLLFDITDFDETLPASWEFDVKRLAASFVLLAREQGCARDDQREATRVLLRSYREHLEKYSSHSPLDVRYASIDSASLVEAAADEKVRSLVREFTESARDRTAENMLHGLLIDGEGTPRFRDDPPTLQRLPPGSPLGDSFRAVLDRYPASLSEERRVILGRYELVDVALKVVGVGSVGARCGVALYLSACGDPLVLQIKEAYPSALEKYGAGTDMRHEGQRIVVGQRVMQSATDIFLGWSSDAEGRPFYVRQLRDMKKSVPPELLKSATLGFLAMLCGWGLARAHAKGGKVIVMAGYFGEGGHCEDALGEFATAYADQCEVDFARFQEAIRRGTFPVTPE